MLERRKAQDAHRSKKSFGGLANPGSLPAKLMTKKARAKPAAADNGEQRKRSILEIPLGLGADWALDASRSLQLEGRRIEGGYPGTVPEARARMKRELTLELERLGFTPPSEAELVVATAAAYDRARVEWQRLGRGSSAPPKARLTPAQASKGHA